MSRLDAAIGSVPADTSPADADVQDTELDSDFDSKAAGDADDNEDGQDGKPGRSAENVRGELLRKLQKSNQELMAGMQALREDNRRLEAKISSVPEKNSSQSSTLDDLTVEQLITMQASVPAEQRPAFDAYLFDRKVDAKVDAKLNKFQSTTQHKQQEAEYNRTAFERWPELRNKSSEFYGIADKILSEMGPAGEKNPRAVLEAANEAGLQLGLSPSGVRHSRREPGNVAPGRSTRGTMTPESGISEENAAIANRLKDAMPGGKFTDEQLKRIAKRTKLYKDNINVRVRS